jgi:hypothetical protein
MKHGEGNRAHHYRCKIPHAPNHQIIFLSFIIFIILYDPHLHQPKLLLCTDHS